ncbi:pseudouridine synthase [Polynucleobacter necessarius]|uniref:pseudouridine synthase n=1 Tax=Polynucleobacter necessarius TaxID=576610 RepID=UPI0018D4ED1C|nr:pseudouridine synthase [Polynucleobacter necessarius]
MKVNSEGVSASRVFLPGDQTYPNLLAFFVAQFPHIETDEWEQRFSDGLILNLDGQCLTARDACQPNTHLLYFRRLARAPEIPFQETILYHDGHILVADKPHFLPVTPSGLYLHQTLLNRLKKITGMQDLSPIHRIDRDTAGLAIFSINPGERAQYQNLFSDRAVRKVYEAIAPYSQDLAERLPMTRQSRIEESEHFLQMSEVPGKPNSDTLIELLEVKVEWAKYRLTLGSCKKTSTAVSFECFGYSH